MTKHSVWFDSNRMSFAHCSLKWGNTRCRKELRPEAEADLAPTEDGSFHELRLATQRKGYRYISLRIGL